MARCAAYEGAAACGCPRLPQTIIIHTMTPDKLMLPLASHNCNFVHRFLPRTRFNERSASEVLELSLVDNAELVFATLSATGRRVLQQGLSRGFETVRKFDQGVCPRLRPWRDGGFRV